jgi:hypothetical protein
MPEFEIYVIKGFNCLIFNESLPMPTPKILIEMLYPGVLHLSNTPKLTFVDIDQANLLNGLGSQLLIQAYSNKLLGNLRTIERFKPFCDDNDIDFGFLEFNWALVDYIRLLYPDKMPSLDNNIAVGFFIKHSFEVFKETGGDITSIHKKIDIESIKKTDDALSVRFPEYKEALSCVELFFKWLAEAGYIHLLVEEANHLTEVSRMINSNRKKNYKVDGGIQVEPIVQQCPYCNRWFEQSMVKSNGRLRAHCGEEPCKRDWDSFRRRRILK